MNKKPLVRSASAEREQWEQRVSKGQAAAHTTEHANISLTVDAGGPDWSDAETAAAFGCHGNTVRNARQRFAPSTAGPVHLPGVTTGVIIRVATVPI